MKFRLPFILVFSIYLGFSQNVTPVDFSSVVEMFPNVRDLAISPNGKELYFSAQNEMKDRSVLITMNMKKGVWDHPKLAVFSGRFHDMEPFFSKDGLKLFFVSNRPLDTQSKEIKDFDIWYVQRKDLNTSWSEPKNLGAPVNSESNEFYPSLSENGNLYFTREDPEKKTKDDLYRSKKLDGRYQKPEKLPDAINSDGYDYNAFIAPDESYLIFGSYQREDSYGSGDMYISYMKDGIWSSAKNLGAPINSKKLDYSPFIDYNTNILYFTSERSVESSNQPDSMNIESILKEFRRYSNGQSRLYQINLEDVLERN